MMKSGACLTWFVHAPAVVRAAACIQRYPPDAAESQTHAVCRLWDDPQGTVLGCMHLELAVCLQVPLEAEAGAGRAEARGDRAAQGALPPAAVCPVCKSAPLVCMWLAAYAEPPFQADCKAVWLWTLPAWGHHACTQLLAWV
jgi:hypothetical protein